MIRKKTVFVIGAGASEPFGLPVGRTLTSAISSRLNITIDDFERFNCSTGDRELLIALLLDQERRQRTSVDSIQELVAQMHRMRDSLKQAPSIDEFLNYHQDNPFIVLAGKLGILRSLLDSEAASALMTSAIEERMDWDKISDKWYFDLWHVIAGGVSPSNVESIYENCTFIVFNYDRCIEALLFDGLRNNFQLSYAEARVIAKRAKLFHPYGVLGPLGWQCVASQQPVPFGASLFGPQLHQLVPQIRTFTEQMDDTKQLEDLRSRVAEAERIIFLGFGFHDQNMEILAGGQPRTNAAILWGTALGFHNSNRVQIEDEIMSQLRGNGGVRAILIAGDCSALFHQFGRQMTR